MKVLMIRPMEHPVEMDIENNLKSLYRELDCNLITIVHPWGPGVALVTDDEGMLKDKPVCRYIPELFQPIVGNFLLCGEYDDLDGEDFTDLPDDQMEYYKAKFWWPEKVFPCGEGMLVMAVTDIDGDSC